MPARITVARDGRVTSSGRYATEEPGTESHRLVTRLYEERHHDRTEVSFMSGHKAFA